MFLVRPNWTYLIMITKQNRYLLITKNVKSFQTKRKLRRL